MKNKYKLFGLQPTNDKTAIRQAYAELLKKYHPDTYRGDKSYAINKTQEIIKAYREIIDYIETNSKNNKGHGFNKAKQKIEKKVKNRFRFSKNKNRTDDEIRFLNTIRIMGIIILILMVLLLI